MKARYIGPTAYGDDDQEAPCVVFGVAFLSGQELDVSNLPETQQRKLAGNGQFVCDGDAPEAPPAPINPEAVDIPEDWAGLHHMQRKALARLLVADAVETSEDADKAIQAELDRRATSTDQDD